MTSFFRTKNANEGTTPSNEQTSAASTGQVDQAKAASAVEAAQDGVDSAISSVDRVGAAKGKDLTFSDGQSVSDAIAEKCAALKEAYQQLNPSAPSVAPGLGSSHQEPDENSHN